MHRSYIKLARTEMQYMCPEGSLLCYAQRCSKCRVIPSVYSLIGNIGIIIAAKYSKTVI